MFSRGCEGPGKVWGLWAMRMLTRDGTGLPTAVVMEGTTDTGNSTLTTWTGLHCLLCPCHVINFVAKCDHPALHREKLGQGEGKWFGQGHTAGSQHQESSGWPCAGSSPNSPSGQLLPSLRLSFPCCKVGVTHHAGMRFKVVAKPNLVCVTWSAVALCAERTLRGLGCAWSPRGIKRTCHETRPTHLRCSARKCGPGLPACPGSFSPSVCPSVRFWRSLIRAVKGTPGAMRAPAQPGGCENREPGLCTRTGHASPQETPVPVSSLRPQ